MFQLASNIEIDVELGIFIHVLDVWIGQIQSKLLIGLVTNGLDGMYLGYKFVNCFFIEFALEK